METAPHSRGSAEGWGRRPGAGRPPSAPAAQPPRRPARRAVSVALAGRAGGGDGARGASAFPPDWDAMARCVVRTEVRGPRAWARSRLTPGPLPAGSELPVAGTAQGDRACWGEEATGGRGGWSSERPTSPDRISGPAHSRAACALARAAASRFHVVVILIPRSVVGWRVLCSLRESEVSGRVSKGNAVSWVPQIL